MTDLAQGFVLRHVAQGFLVSIEHQVFAPTSERAHLFETIDDLLDTALDIWGEDALAIHFQILRVRH